MVLFVAIARKKTAKAPVGANHQMLPVVELQDVAVKINVKATRTPAELARCFKKPDRNAPIL
jgi:hypothetical protein